MKHALIGNCKQNTVFLKPTENEFNKLYKRIKSKLKPHQKTYLSKLKSITSKHRYLIYLINNKQLGGFQ